METLGNQNKPKTSPIYYCNYCDYGTCKLSNYTSHKSTAKHIKYTKTHVLETFGNNNKPKTSSSQYLCEKCNFNTLDKTDYKNDVSYRS